jgi:hypothetical protein
MGMLPVQIPTRFASLTLASRSLYFPTRAVPGRGSLAGSGQARRSSLGPVGGSTSAFPREARRAAAPS